MGPWPDKELVTVRLTSTKPVSKWRRRLQRNLALIFFWNRAGGGFAGVIIVSLIVRPAHNKRSWNAGASGSDCAKR